MEAGLVQPGQWVKRTTTLESHLNTASATRGGCPINPNPLVSVVVPAYNAERTITRAIQSALHQDYQLVEVIVADDCSTDATREVVRQLQDPRIAFLPSSVNCGAASTRNRGIRHATGTYVAFLDADDEWLPGKLSRQVHLMEQHPNACVATCDCLFFDGSGLPKETFFQQRIPCDGENAWQALLAYNFVQTSDRKSVV